MSAPIKPRWTAIELDETAHVNIPEVKRFYTVYMFDRNLVTHICSQDKHYWLDPVYVNVEFHDGVSDEDRDRIQGDLSGEMSDADYHLEGEIERLIETGAARIEEYGDLGEDETEDDVREHWQGNCPL